MHQLFKKPVAYLKINRTIFWGQQIMHLCKLATLLVLLKGLNDKNKGRESRDPIPIKGQFHEIFLTLPGPKGSKSPDTVPLTCLGVIYT